MTISAATPPNIVFTIADDQRFDLIEGLGDTQCHTPHLNRLMQRGTCFTHACIMGSTHAAVCAPSRAMLHTGMSLFQMPATVRDYPWICDDTLPEWKLPATRRLPLLGETLRHAGYHCHGVGKWHNGAATFARSFDSGGAIFFGGMSSHFRVPVHEFDPSGKYLSSRARIGRRHSTELFADAALKFIGSSAARRQPFFLYCAFTAPHDPRKTQRRWHGKYAPEGISVPPNFLLAHPFDNGELQVRDELLVPAPRTKKEVRREIADYYAMTEHMDDAIGRIHRAVEAAGLAENTIFVHTADHGLAVGQHGLLGKQNMYDHSIRVPLLISGPGFGRNVRDHRLCYMPDLYPTLLEAVGAKVPETCHWRSLAKPSSRRKQIFSAYGECQRMVRTDQFKLIQYETDKERHTQLFDVAGDPWETRNLADEPACAKTLHKMKTLLNKCRREAADPCVI